VSRMLACLPKFLRMRFFSVKEYAIEWSPQVRLSPAPGTASKKSNARRRIKRKNLPSPSTGTPRSAAYVDERGDAAHGALT
jgi:hypothetical protein